MLFNGKLKVTILNPDSENGKPIFRETSTEYEIREEYDKLIINLPIKGAKLTINEGKEEGKVFVIITRNNLKYNPSDPKSKKYFVLGIGDIASKKDAITSKQIDGKLVKVSISKK